MSTNLSGLLTPEQKRKIEWDMYGIKYVFFAHPSKLRVLAITWLDRVSDNIYAGKIAFLSEGEVLGLDGVTGESWSNYNDKQD